MESCPSRIPSGRSWSPASATTVKELTGGLTVIAPVKGTWVNPEDDEEYTERMIPVRIMCDEETIEKIALMTKKYYDQEAVMVHLVSTKAIIF